MSQPSSSPSPLRDRARRTRTGRLFVPPSPGEASRLTELLRRETVGGGLLIGAAVIALVWANTPWRGAYTALGALTVGPSALHLDLSLSTWAADGLLAIFFFVAGLELKREFVAGDLRDPARAVLPVAAAVGGMAVPAVLYTAINLGDPEASRAGPCRPPPTSPSRWRSSP